MKLSTVFAGLALLPTLAAAFVHNGQSQTLLSRSSSSLSMAKGFDSNAKPPKKTKSAGQVQRENASAKYDEIAAQGGQEYSIYIRQFGGEDDTWLPCGSIAVPRAAQVSNAIFENEDALKKAIVRQYPKLMGYEAEFEFGYNLKVFSDEPIEVARKGNRNMGPSFGNWMSNLLSPIDASKVVPPS